MTDVEGDYDIEALVVGAVGAAAGVMALCQQSIKKARDDTKNFVPALKKLQDTITLIEPKIEELDRSNQQHHANISEEQIRVFTKKLEESKELVKTCEAIPRWNKNKKRKYTKTLVEVDSSLRADLVLLWRS